MDKSLPMRRERLSRVSIAAGEVACVSVHGANRLGSNSLLEASVFGQRAGKAIAEFMQEGPQLLPISGDPAEQNRQRIHRHLDSDGPELVDQIGEELKETMTQNCGIFRDEDNAPGRHWMTSRHLKERLYSARIMDKSHAL